MWSSMQHSAEGCTLAIYTHADSWIYITVPYLSNILILVSVPVKGNLLFYKIDIEFRVQWRLLDSCRRGRNGMGCQQWSYMHLVSFYRENPQMITSRLMYIVKSFKSTEREVSPEKLHMSHSKREQFTNNLNIKLCQLKDLQSSSTE